MTSWRIRITDPTAQVYDVSADLDLSQLGTVHELREDDLTQAAYSDMTFKVYDPTGAFESWIGADPDPDAIYSVTVERQLDGESGWTLLFAGLLDLPWSLSYDRLGLWARVRVFGYGKLLERASAEAVSRTFSAMAGSVTSGTRNVTLTTGATTGMLPGDEVQLADALGNETQVVASVTSGTAFTTVDTWSNTYAAAALVVLTPFYRNYTVAQLVALLFTQAGITDQVIQTGSVSASYPFGSQVPAPGLVGTMRSLSNLSGSLRARTSDGTYTTATIGGTWSKTGPLALAEYDWTPYLASAPGALVNSGTGALKDSEAPDHTAAVLYSLVSINAGGNVFQLWVYRAGVAWIQIDTYTDTIGDGYELETLSCEWDPTKSEVWASFRRGNPAGYYIKRTNGSSVTTVKSGTGSLGVLRRLRLASPKMAHHVAGATTMSLYDITSGSTTPITVAAPAGLLMGTARAFDNGARVAAVYQLGGASWVRVWLTPAWTLEDDYRISTSTSYPALSTVFYTGSEYAYVGYAGGQHFAVQRAFGLVVPYADFSGMSCARALRELALISGSVFFVTRTKQGQFKPRMYVGSTSLATLGVPFELVEMPLWEWYRASASVTGKDAADTDVDEIAGDAGDSARRLEVAADLEISRALASAAALSYYTVLSVRRRQMTGEWTAPAGVVLAPGDRVTYHGNPWLVVEARHELADGTVALVLAEVI